MARTIIFTRLVARPGNLDELLAALDELAVATRAEPGCEMFVVHPARDKADVVLGYEVFSDEEALTAHRATDAVAHARAQLAELLAEPPNITYALDCARPYALDRTSSSSRTAMPRVMARA